MGKEGLTIFDRGVAYGLLWELGLSFMGKCPHHGWSLLGAFMEGELSLWAHPQKLQSRCLLWEANVFSPALLPKISRKDVKSCLPDLEADLLIGPRASMPVATPFISLIGTVVSFGDIWGKCLFCPLELSSHST